MALRAWMDRRADVAVTVTQLEASNTTTANATLALLADLVATESRSIRSSTIILTAFNITAAFATALCILYDSYLVSKRSGRGFFRPSAIHPAETFPLILSVGIIVQGLIFAAAQGFGLNSPFIDGCSTISQVLLPAIFVVPYIQVVFGIESALRSIRKTPFQARGKYDVNICVAIITLLLVFTWIPTFVNPQSDHCFAQFAYYIQRYGLQGLILIVSAIVLTKLSVVAIFYRLATVTAIDLEERIAASRMVYYLILGISSWVFAIPWFVKLVKGDVTLLTSLMATVVLNLSGILNLVLQLFLRTNTATTSIKPRGASLSIQKHNIRFWGPNELGLTNQMLRPICRPRSMSSISSRRSLFRSEKEPILTPASSGSPKQLRPQPGNTCKPITLPSSPRPVVGVTSPVRHKRNLSYSLFPAEPSSVETKHDPDDFLPPPPPIRFIGDGTRHRRDSSMFSSATVQIGLRLSHAMDADIPTTPTTRLHITTSNLKPSPLSADQGTNMKTLPAVPMSESAPKQLSPTIYSPNSKNLVSPRQQDAQLREVADWI